MRARAQREDCRGGLFKFSSIRESRRHAQLPLNLERRGDVHVRRVHPAAELRIAEDVAAGRKPAIDYLALEHALYNAPINSQSRSRRCRRERTGDVRHQRSDLLGRGKSLDERRWTNLRKELLLEFVKRLSLGLRKCVDEIDNSTRFRWARQNTVDRDAGASDRFGQAT
jgi:hypothetical protein